MITLPFLTNLRYRLKMILNHFWLLKMHKTPAEARFVVASRNCNTKALSKAVAKFLN